MLLQLNNEVDIIHSLNLKLIILYSFLNRLAIVEYILLHYTF